MTADGVALVSTSAGRLEVGEGGLAGGPLWDGGGAGGVVDADAAACGVVVGESGAGPGETWMGALAEAGAGAAFGSFEADAVAASCKAGEFVAS